MVTSAGHAGAASVDEVLQRMADIDAALPSADGVAVFNRMYAQVTRLVRDALKDEQFSAGEFLERLDVHFANLFFTAYDAHAAGGPVPVAWAPLFEARVRPATHPLQFALAGMTTHISHDLPIAVVATCRELALEPTDGSPQHRDYSRTNEVLDHASEEIKSWFDTGLVGVVDRAGGRFDDAFAMFGVHSARAAAWQVSQLMWQMADNPRLDRMLRESVGQGVALMCRGILL